MLSTTSSKTSSVVPLKDGVWSLITVPSDGLAMVMLGGSAAATEIEPPAARASNARATHDRRFPIRPIGSFSRRGRDCLSIPIAAGLQFRPSGKASDFCGANDIREWLARRQPRLRTTPLWRGRLPGGASGRSGAVVAGALVWKKPPGQAAQRMRGGFAKSPVSRPLRGSPALASGGRPSASSMVTSVP